MQRFSFANHAVLFRRTLPIYVLLFQLVDVLKRRLVTITGDNGIGKTTLAIAISNYVAERRYSLSDGVVFVRAEGLKASGS